MLKPPLDVKTYDFDIILMVVPTMLPAIFY